MLRALRHWAARAFAPRRPPTPAHAQRAAAQARRDRAEAIAALRRDIRALQHGIADVSAALDGGLAGAERAAQEGRLAALERELEQKQRELARFQARV
jgi:hypothetical protein